MLSGWSPNALQFVKNLDHHWKPFQRVFTELFLYQLQYVWDPVCYHWYCYYYHVKHFELRSISFIFHLKSSKGCIVDPRRWKMQNISQRTENSDQIKKERTIFQRVLLNACCTPSQTKFRHIRDISSSFLIHSYHSVKLIVPLGSYYKFYKFSKNWNWSQMAMKFTDFASPICNNGSIRWDISLEAYYSDLVQK